MWLTRLHVAFLETKPEAAFTLRELVEDSRIELAVHTCLDGSIAMRGMQSREAHQHVGHVPGTAV